MMNKVNMFFICLLIIGIYGDAIVPMTPKTVIKVNQSQYTYKYYSVQVPPSTNSDLLLITAISEDDTYLIIYTSVNPQIHEPDENNSTQSCYYSSVDACAIKLSTPLPDTVYFSIWVSTDTVYDVQASFHNYFPLKQGRYTLNFTNFQSAMAQLPYSQFQNNKSIVIVTEYRTLADSGKLQMFASLDSMPGSDTDIYAVDMGAYRRLLKLKPPQSPNSSYNILISGMNGSSFFLYVMESNNNLQLNKTHLDEINEETIYELNSPFLTAPSFQMLLDLNSYEGYGVFYVNYCNGIQKFQHQNMNGMNGEILISLQQRTKCYKNNKGLLIETLEINITNVIWKFSFSIGLYQGDYLISISSLQQQYGILQSSIESRKYTIIVPQSQSMNITCQTIIGSLSYTLLVCPASQNCTEMEIKPNIQNNFPIQTKTNYVLLIEHLTNQTSQYLLQVRPLNIPSTIIQLGKDYSSIIQQNQYQYYLINTTKIGPPRITLLTIRITNVNGQAFMLTSLTQKTPTFDMLSNQSLDVTYSWRGKVDYEINDSVKAVYIGIMGDSQSLYHIQATVNTNADLPSRYTKLIQQLNNEFVINDDSLIVYAMYASHNIPYTLSLDPIPECISYGTKLPLQKTCKPLPLQFHDRVLYLQISQPSRKAKATFKFTAYVNSGNYTLIPDQPLFISCENDCFEFIDVKFSQKDISIIHQGDGMINLIGQANTVSNGILKLNCINAPCHYQINASMPYQGQMHVAYENSQGAEIQWRSKPITWNKSPKHLYFRIERYLQKNNFLIFSDGMTPSIYYNIYAIQDNYTNILNYTYPTENMYMHQHVTHPSFKLQIVQVNQSKLKELGCLKAKTYCLVTISIYINKTVEYDSLYILKGTGYYSSNTYDYYIPLDFPYLITEQYSVNYFRCSLDNSSQSARLSIVPLQNCRPQIVLKGVSKGVYTDTIIKSINNEVQFSISSNTNCAYYLSLSKSLLLTVVPNILYSLSMVDSSTSQFYTQFVFSRKYLSEMWINIQDGQLTTILVNRIINDNVILPSITTYDYMINGKTLKLPDNETGRYAVKIISKTQNLISVIIQDKSQPIELLHNQQQFYSFKTAGEFITYHYRTISQYGLFAIVAGGEVQLTIKKSNNDVILLASLTPSSDPWIWVPFNGSNNFYSILIKCVSLIEDSLETTVQFHSEQYGNKGLIHIYDGVMSLDSLVRLRSTNCYHYQTPLIVGRDTITIDLTYINSTINETSIKYHLTIPDRVSKAQFSIISPNTLRVETPFIPNTTFKFCFTLQDVKLIGLQYYIISQGPLIHHLPPRQPLMRSQSNFLQIFQVINPSTTPLTHLVHLTNCFGRTDVLTSSSYVDAELGRFTHSHDYWTDQDNIFTLTTVEEGYEYLSLRSLPNSSFRLNSMWVDSNSSLKKMSEWNLVDKNIVKLYYDNENNLVIELPKLLSNGTIPVLCHIQYSLFIHKTGHHDLNTKSLAKCPFLFNTSTFQRYNQTIHQANETPTFIIPTHDLPQKFNITALAEVYIPGQQFVLPYYYQEQRVSLANDSWWSNFIAILKPIFLVLGISTLISAIGLSIAMYRRWILRRNEAQVAFEMSPFNAQAGLPERPVDQQQQPSHRRPLNENVGYGEFVDETS